MSSIDSEMDWKNQLIKIFSQHKVIFLLVSRFLPTMWLGDILINDLCRPRLQKSYYGYSKEWNFWLRKYFKFCFFQHQETITGYFLTCFWKWADIFQPTNMWLLWKAELLKRISLKKITTIPRSQQSPKTRSECSRRFFKLLVDVPSNCHQHRFGRLSTAF